MDFLCEGVKMPSELNGFNDAILGQLSRIGIELLHDNNERESEDLVPKAIYEISKQTAIAKQTQKRGRNK